ncbi:AAA family ATPase [Corallococcus macrosporus]|uniref:AAA family ATPase n=1 Tax=Corallococcus macrosporus TaxID=35 RepID=UPI0009E3A038|nr:AAA family ATPase [Corallococcus macrosporus]
MQLKKFKLSKLFGRIDHEIDFPVSEGDSSEPSLVILHGPNGIGKTTILKMIDGIMRLDFTVFRQTPFSRCSLQFSNNKSIDVRSNGGHSSRTLEVAFDGKVAKLNVKRAGPATHEDAAAVDGLRTDFFAQTNRIKFEFINTNRTGAASRDATERYRELADEMRSIEARIVDDAEIEQSASRDSAVLARSKIIARRKFGSTATTLARFIAEAQINYRNFFSTSTPDLFPKILQRLGEQSSLRYTSEDLLARLRSISERDGYTQRLGLQGDRWNYDQLAQLLTPKSSENTNSNALAVVGTYVEFLESRAAERALVAERLLTFEKLASELLHEKKVTVEPEVGFRIETRDGQVLVEEQLSSGELHLLYLMVSALTTRRRGTVIAIDEPELSMHIAWQRRLVRTLFQCASKAEPQFILATHSPDIAAEYPESMIDLAG